MNKVIANPSRRHKTRNVNIMTDAPLDPSRKSFYQTDFCARVFKLPARRFYQEPAFQYLADEAKLREIRQQKEQSQKVEKNEQIDQSSDEEEEEVGKEEVNKEEVNKEEVNKEEANKEEEKGEDKEKPKEIKRFNISPLSERIQRIVTELVKATTYTTTYSCTYSKELRSPPRNTTITLPNTGIRRADPVQYRPQIYEKRPELWQKVFSEWDLEQRRNGYNSPAHTANGIANRLAQDRHRQALRRQTERKQVLPRSQKGSLKRGDATELRRTSEKKQVRITEPIATNTTTEYCYPRPPPGYGGYLPRLLMVRCNDQRFLKQDLSSTTRRAYRAYNYYNSNNEHAHQGPLSKTVTLTHPFNPFNKVDKQPLVLEPLPVNQEQNKVTSTKQ